MRVYFANGDCSKITKIKQMFLDGDETVFAKYDKALIFAVWLRLPKAKKRIANGRLKFEQEMRELENQ